VRLGEKKRTKIWLAGTLLWAVSGLASLPASSQEIPEWRQILALNRFSGKLTVLAIDPTDSNHIVVGTELGTLLITDDGGITWTEREISPYYDSGRLPIGLNPIFTPPTSHGFNLQHFGINVGSRPPMMTYGVDTEMVPMTPYDVSTSLWAGSNIRPDTTDRNIHPQIPNRVIRGDAIHRNLPDTRGADPMKGLTLITDKFSREFPAQMPIRGIAFCPGAAYSIFASTEKTLFGSFDGGETFVRLFGLPPRFKFSWVACSPTNPKEIAATSNWGLFRSRDGGHTWDEDVLFFPAREVRSITYAMGADNREMMYVAAEDRVYTGFLDEWERLEWKYPTYYKSYFTPWANIFWVIKLSNGDIWAATEEGVRVSKDGGDNWNIGGDAMYEREVVKQLIPGTDSKGKEIVTIVMDKRVYAADIDGKGAIPFHEGLAMKNVERVATVPTKPGQPGNWWVLTQNELWTDQKQTAPRRQEPSVQEFIDWALYRRRFSPSLQAVIEAVYERLEISPQKTTEMERRSRDAFRLPQVHFYGEVQNIDYNSFESVSVTSPALVDFNTNRYVGYGLIQLHWNLDQLRFSNFTAYYISRFREVDRIRTQLRETLEDSWYERERHLKTMLGGRFDALQGEILRTRVECIEALFQAWTTGKYWDLARGGATAMFEPRSMRSNALGRRPSSPR
jgi:hypothetical protein